MLTTTVFTALTLGILELVCGLDCPFTLSFYKTRTVRAPANQSLHLLLNLGAWLGITPLTASPNLTSNHIEVSSYAALYKVNTQANLLAVSVVYAWSNLSLFTNRARRATRLLYPALTLLL